MKSPEMLDPKGPVKASRLSFGEHLVTLGEEDSRVVALDADLSKSTQTCLFQAKFPKRHFNLGIAEANMIGVAAGLAAGGKIPFAASFGCFLTGRFDQIRMSVSFTGSNVRLIGTHAGVTIGEDGHSQMALEDIALMTSLPNMTVFQPADDFDTRSFMSWSLKHSGPCYMRLTRQNLPSLKRSSPNFKVGTWDEILELGSSHKDIVFVGSGGVFQAIDEATKVLASRGHSISVINAAWLQPYDQMILKKIAAVSPKVVVTVEDHYISCGLGAIVAKFYGLNQCRVPQLNIGVTGFGQSGSPQENMDHYGLSAPKIVEQVEAFLRGSH
jgi:transketolase